MLKSFLHELFERVLLIVQKKGYVGTLNTCLMFVVVLIFGFGMMYDTVRTVTCTVRIIRYHTVLYDIYDNAGLWQKKTRSKDTVCVPGTARRRHDDTGIGSNSSP